MASYRRKVHAAATAVVAAVCAVGMTAGVAMADMSGIDVSGWQPAAITRAVPADFAIVKVTEGTWYTNPSWTAQARGAVDTGKAVGLYHYADGGYATTEADMFVNASAAYHGRAMLVLDWESGGNAAWGNGAWITSWVNRVHDRTQVWPVVYVQRSAVWQVPSYVRQHCMLWVAQYASMAATGYQDNPWNAGASGEGMLQYTSSGRLPGYAGNLDLNRFFGDRVAWRKIACGERRGCSASSAGAGAPVTRTETTTTTTDLNALATAVIRGDYGNGADRKARLGGNYSAVMAIVNARLGGGSYTGPTTVTTTTTRSYVVRAGDTVSAIAARTGLRPATAWSVPSGNINRIYPGQTITYRGTAGVASTSGYNAYSGGHVVRAGESLWSIYGAGWKAAARRNGLRPPYTIYPGQMLR